MSKATHGGPRKGATRAGDKTMEKHRSLSTKSLALVWDWCERNQGTPLAEAYITACAALGAFDRKGIAAQLKTTWKRKGGYNHILEASDLYRQTFIYRDTVGRTIFDLMKREKTKCR